MMDEAADEGALRIEGTRIAGSDAAPPPRAKILDASGLTLVPALIDAHVHLSVAGEPARIAREEVRRGVAAVLDLAAPERLLPLHHPPLRIRFSGPILTAPSGYPTRSWGSNGEGLEVANESDARAAVRRLAAKGARFVKLAFDPRFPVIAPEVARAAAEEAHLAEMLVAAHALEAGSVRRALDAGADVLAHTPRDPLPSDLVRRMKGKWVVSTLRAYGTPPARLRTLRDAGARVAYGTDLGNEDTAPGIDARELLLLADAGVDPLPAATSAAASLLGFADLGTLAPGSSATLMAVRGTSPAELADPVWVMIDGAMVTPGAAGAA